MYLFNLLPKILPFFWNAHHYTTNTFLFWMSGNAAATALLSRADQYPKGQMAK